MSWASILASILGFIRSFYDAMLRRKERELGRAEATAEALTKQIEENKRAEAVRIEAAKAHHDHPGLDGYDQEFRRAGE